MTIGDLLESVFSFISKNEDVRHVLKKAIYGSITTMGQKSNGPNLDPFLASLQCLSPSTIIWQS